MAKITVTPDVMRIELSRLEKAAALRGDVVVQRAHVGAARVAQRPLAELRGVRAPGAGFPGLLAIGRWQRRHGADFVVLRRGEPAVIIELTDGAPFRRLVIGTKDPDPVLAALG